MFLLTSKELKRRSLRPPSAVRDHREKHKNNEGGIQPQTAIISLIRN